MIQAAVYLIEGPRSLSDAIEIFNNVDHSKKIFGQKSGMGCYIKYTLGKDFAVSALSKRHGFSVEEQVVSEKSNKLNMYIKLIRFLADRKSVV